MPSQTEKKRPLMSLRHSLKLITTAGCLCMVYVTGVSSPAFVEFMRSFGATDAHFGLLGAVPMIMISFQFVGAVITNAIRRRKLLFMVLVILGRCLYLLVAFLPLLFPSAPGITFVISAIAFTALASGLMNLTGPLWLSWMADLIPRNVLNTYWGHRQRYMYATWTASFLAVVAFTSFWHLPIRVAFPIMATIGVAAGIADILLFLHVPEPPNTVLRGSPVLTTILAPLKNRDYRSFVTFSCAWTAAALFSAVFMPVYALKILHLTVWQTTLIWCCSGAGIALVSSQWGKLADRHGHRPIFAICIMLKSVIIVIFLLITPAYAFRVLSLAFFIDSLFDAGMMVASNGYMLKIAPRQNRSMFIAALASFSGICGGLGAIAGGFFLKATADFTLVMAGRTWTNYSLLFLVNAFMRLACIALAFRVREPSSTTPTQLLYAMTGTRSRFLSFPIGLYRRLNQHTTRLVANMRRLERANTLGR